ncbi:hypothetical protein ACFWBN_31570 [Streptomyces sp. NPDC059989]|uniref:hypothetical protein n=1 Tax=Streptomyces sp. NPDC059989 TaxID=3347026 RepID=UPI0036A8C668
MKRGSSVEHVLLLSIIGAGILILAQGDFRDQALWWVVAVMTAVAGTYWLSLVVRPAWLVMRMWGLRRR